MRTLKEVKIGSTVSVEMCIRDRYCLCSAFRHRKIDLTSSGAIPRKRTVFDKKL